MNLNRENSTPFEKLQGLQAFHIITAADVGGVSRGVCIVQMASAAAFSVFSRCLTLPICRNVNPHTHAALSSAF